jgi:hypothetical protein
MSTYWSDRLRAAVRAGASARGLIRDHARPNGYGVSALAQWAVLVALADIVLADGRVPEDLHVPTSDTNRPSSLPL